MTQTSPRDLAFYINPLDPRLEDQLAWLSDQGVSLIGTDGLGRRDAGTLRRIGDLFTRHGMRVVAVHGEPALADPSGDVRALREAHLDVLERAAVWGAGQVVLHFRMPALPWREGMRWDVSAHISRAGLEAYDAGIADLLSWLCDEAGRRGVAIALENLPNQFAYSYQVEEIVAQVERVGAPNLGICFDSGHAHAAGLDVPAAIRTCGRHLATLHLHDNFGGGDPRATIAAVDRHLAPGLGTIDWPAAIRALDDAGYPGPAVFEGVNTGKGPGKDDAEWREAVLLTLRNWRLFERLAQER